MLSATSEVAVASTCQHVRAIFSNLMLSKMSINKIANKGDLTKSSMPQF